MIKKFLHIVVAFSLLVCGIWNTSENVVKAAAKQMLHITIVGDSDNDLYKVLMDNYEGIKRYDTFDEAFAKIEENQTKGIMILADEYPTLNEIGITEEQNNQLTEKGIRLYIEYPSNNTVLGINYDGTALMDYDRAVVRNADALNMEEYSLLYVHGARYVKKSDITNAWLVNAKVAGYDTAVFGLTNCTPYAMIDVHDNVMVASTKLSQFVSARYAPYERWQKLWLSILSWVGQESVSSIEWQPSVTAKYGKDEALSANAYAEAVDLNTQWYLNSGFVLSDKDASDYETEKNDNPIYKELTPGGNGSHGVLEAFVSGKAFTENGDQKMRFWRRADCNGESAGALALAGVVLNNEEYKTVASNIVEWLLTESMMSQGNRADPSSPEYGLLAWHDGSNDYVSYYGDDNAKAILGLISAASALGTDQYDQRILEAILGNFRTTGVNGFRGQMLSNLELNENGWEHFYNKATIHYAPHFEALPWATYLWAYDKTGYKPLLERTKTGIKNMMKAYENHKWQWTNGLQQERAKMILPLAWLVRIEDTPEHRQWLDTMINDMMKYRDASTGAIRDAFGESGEGTGVFGPFTDNSQYGLHEAPVIQENGDPCIDALYTSSFAMLSLNEAYAATNNETYKEYSDSLSDFFVRIQQVSDNKNYNGVWFRGFDYEKWETYGSDGDAAWGVWCTETGWTQSWISNTLSLKTLHTNLWDYTKNTTVKDYFKETAQLMVNYDPNELNPSITSDEVADIHILLDGVYGSAQLLDDWRNYWTGAEGKDVSFVVDYQEEKTFDALSLGFLCSYRSGIRVPRDVEILVSNDGENFTTIATCGTTKEFTAGDNSIERFTVDLAETKARYVKVVAKNAGPLPAGHSYAGSPSWICMDEFGVVISSPTKSDLYDLLKIARPLKVGIYTPSTGKVFEDARKAAEEVYAKADAGAAEWKTAYDRLKEAYANLEQMMDVISMTETAAGNKDLLYDLEYSESYVHNDGYYVGWQNKKPIEVIVELNENTTIKDLGFSSSSRPTWGIVVPKATMYVADSLDGTWTNVGSIEAKPHTLDPATPDGIKSVITLEDGVSGRYVKYVFESDSEWVFIDELMINNPESGRAKLQELVKSVGSTKMDGYTEESVHAFTKALAAAEATIQEPDSTYEKFTKAYDDLEAAYNGLTLKSGIVSVNISIDPTNNADAHWNTLVDRVFGSGTTHAEPAYLGWCDKDNVEIVIDMGTIKKIESLGYSALSGPRWGIYKPDAVFYAYNALTQEYEEIHTIQPTAHEGAFDHYMNTCESFMLQEPAYTRYVKVVLQRDMDHVEDSWPRSEWYFLDEILMNDYYTIHTNTPKHGKVEVASDHEGRVLRNGSATISVTPDVGYELDSFKINGENVECTDGVYTIEGITEDQDVEVTFKNIVFAKEELPTIQVSKENIILMIGDVFDPMKDVRAVSSEGADITASVEIVKNTVNTSQTGKYEVLYRVVDAKGAVGEKRVIVTVKADKKQLENLIQEADQLKKDGYTSDSWAAFAKALKEAKAVKENDAATQEAVDHAIVSLANSVIHLKAVSKQADKALLESLVASLEHEDPNIYTNKSWKSFISAMKKAKAVLADTKATDEEVDQAYQYLRYSYLMLIKAEAEENVEDHPQSSTAEEKDLNTAVHPNTGDATSMQMTWLLMVLSGGCLIGLSKKRKKNNVSK